MSKSNVRQRHRLYVVQEGKCYWCGIVMVLLDPPRHQRYPANLATLDHLDSRWSPLRGKFPGQPRRVLACLSCNNRRAAEEEKQAIAEGRYVHVFGHATGK